MQGVGVLLQPTLGAVYDVSSEVGHDECLFVCEPLPLACLGLGFGPGFGSGFGSGSGQGSGQVRVRVRVRFGSGFGSGFGFGFGLEPLPLAAAAARELGREEELVLLVVREYLLGHALLVRLEYV